MDLDFSRERYVVSWLQKFWEWLSFFKGKRIEVWKTQVFKMDRGWELVRQIEWEQLVSGSELEYKGVEGQGGVLSFVVEQRLLFQFLFFKLL